MKQLRIVLLAFLTLCALPHLFSETNENNFLNEENSEEAEGQSSSKFMGTTFCVPTDFASAMDSLLYSYYALHAKKGRCNKNDLYNVEYPDSVYRDRLKRLPYEVEMPFNDAVKACINMYTSHKRNQVENMLGTSKYYFPIFEDILNRYKVPMEFKFLPVIESALNPQAVSRVGAAGLWQFMPSTARMYGLTINTLVDERRDPVKSTKAAAKYIKDLYHIYGDWHLAIAAYNCGPGSLNKAIRRAGGKKDYWKIYPYLPAETRGYVPIFIAANYVMTYYAKHNLCPARIDMPAYTDTVRIYERVPFSVISEVLRIPEDELEALNPQYRRNIIPGNSGEYYLRLPNHYSVKFIANEDSIYARSNGTNEKDEENEDVNNSVAKVESVFGSNLVNNEKLTKVARKRAKYERKPRRTKNESRNSSYKVKSGDTLSDIADKYNVKISDVKRWNGIKGTTLRPGQKITIRNKH